MVHVEGKDDRMVANNLEIGQALDLDAAPLLALQMKYNLLSAKRNKTFLERLKEIPRIAAVF